MLYCTLLLLKGKVNATLKCKTQPDIGTRATYSFPTHASGGTLLLGDGVARHARLIEDKTGEITSDPLEPQTMWAAYLSEKDECLCWGAADGKWHEHIACEIMDFVEERARSRKEAESDAEGKESVELADFGMIDVQREQIAEQVSAPLERETDAPMLPSAQDEVVVCEQSPQVASVRQDAEKRDDPPLFADDVQRLLGFFQENPAYTPLEARLPGSRWVEVREEDSAYLLGMLFDSTPTPTHLVYGVRGQYERPFAPDAEWLALDDSAQTNEGYWLIYHTL